MRMRTTLGLAAAAICGASANAFAEGGTIEPLTSVRVASGLVYPTFATHAPGDYNRMYILEKRGVIRVLNIKTGALNATPFLDINSLVAGGTTSNDERGLLGLTFHPDYQNNGTFYVNYTANSGATTVARYTTTSADLANPSSAAVLLTFAQPYTNHNGGWIDFSPADGYLYVATGDGGLGGDPGNRAQDITNQPLGKILRYDAGDGTGPLTIPPSNPFVGVTGDDAIWAYGVRNPWRTSFDRLNGDMYLADVGQGNWEEVNYERANVPGGRNYGWRCREGQHNYDFTGSCSSQTFTEPYWEYSHSLGLSITGGYNYRGCAIPSLENTYFVADYVSARIWTMNGGGTSANLQQRQSELTPDVGAIGRIASFGEDARGELYIVDHGTSGSGNGELFKVVPVTPTIKPQDFDCDGVVGFADLLALLASWGNCVGCVTDVDGDDEITFLDLLEVLASWG